MNEELNKYKSYINGHILTISLIKRKLEGENLEDFTEKERLLLRTIYDMHLDEEKSAIED